MDHVNYLQQGLLSGWTSGVLSGHAPVSLSPFQSGAVRIDTYPITSGAVATSLTAVYRPDAACPLTIWVPGSPIAPGDVRLLDWLFRRDDGKGE